MLIVKIDLSSPVFDGGEAPYRLKEALSELGGLLMRVSVNPREEEAGGPVEIGGKRVGGWGLNEREGETGVLSPSEDLSTVPEFEEVAGDDDFSHPASLKDSFKEKDRLLQGDPMGLALQVLDNHADGSFPLTPQDAARVARTFRHVIAPILPLEEMLLGARIKPKGFPADLERVGSSGDEWSVMPMMRAYDMNGAIFSPVAAPTGLALMLARGGRCLPMELSAQAMAEIQRGEWHEILRMGAFMVECFDASEEG